jgi:GTP cyclohydrolase I
MGKTLPFTDYSCKMPDLNFEYNENFYPNDHELPDPQVNPVLVGARIPIRKVGIAPVDLPIVVKRRDGSEQVLQAEASLYCSLDNPDAKGLNLSRLYLLMHDRIRDHLSIDGIRDALRDLAEKQGSENAYCKLRFKYPMSQRALRTDAEGHIAYKVELEGRYHKGEYRFFLTVDYVYSSTCPCSFELAYDARTKRRAAANAHSQRSIMRVTVEFNPEQIIWIEDLVDLLRHNIPTEVQIVVKRRDEQAFAELNGSNLLFAEDAVRIVYQALDVWYDWDIIQDFVISTSHGESLHPWDAIALTSKFDPSEKPGCLR